MNTPNLVILLGIVPFPTILVFSLTSLLNRYYWSFVREMQENNSEFENGFHHTIETVANVISKSETIAPNAGELSKVELQTVQLKTP